MKYRDVKLDPSQLVSGYHKPSVSAHINNALDYHPVMSTLWVIVLAIWLMLVIIVITNKLRKATKCSV